ncbi:MAG TPA: hypothetical protein VG755_37960 [Nannocystaceae bacterium]|nr:hypothetical protein [Nannocystaceae bacterium]
MAASNGFEAKQALKGGVTAGVIAGGVLSICMAIMCAIKGIDVWSNVFKGAAAPFIGQAAYEPGFALGPVTLGVLCHFAVSIVWGMLFGLVAYGFSKPVTVLASVAWGFVVWGGMFYVVLPLVGLGDMARNAPIASAIVTHTIFGVTMGLAFLPFQKPHHVHVGRHMPVHGH